MTHTDRCGENSLEEIYRSEEKSYGICEVVRWCRNCGAVVVDVDYDGRFRPGEIMPMQFPEMSKRVWHLADAYLKSKSE
jgi:hypothetical protein